MATARRWLVGVGCGVFLLAAAAGCGATTAWAQPATELLRKHLPPTKFEDVPLDELVRRADNEYRLLVMYIRRKNDPTTEAMDKRVWNNPTLAAHVRWHSIAYKFDYADNPGLSERLGVCYKETPAVVVARVDNGAFEVMSRMLTIRNPFASIGQGGDATSHGQVLGLEPNAGGIADIYPGTLKVLQDTDTALQAVHARDPVWAMEHEQRNPEPQPPVAGDPLSSMEDEDAPAVPDPEPIKGTPDVAGKVDVYERLEDARASVAEGNLYLATGLYTWLWERAVEVDPAFRAAKRSVLASEMRELAEKHPAARKRFARLKTFYDERLLWTTYESLGDWFLLNGVVGETAETIAYLDLFVNDLDEGSLLPRADLAAYRLMVGRDDWTDPWDLGESPRLPAAQLGSESRFRPVVTTVTQRAAQVTRGDAGGRVRPETGDTEKIDAFREVFALDECVRLHVACLRAGREEDAWRVASTLLAAQNTPAARHALVAGALAAGEPRTRHAQLLKDAARAGEDHAILRTRLERAIGATVK